MTKEETDLIIAEQNKSTEEILKAVAKIKSDYHELCNLKDMRIAELEEKISVLLSCKNCPENKGGLLCQKEYEDKCLAQKIQFIKELQEENAELKEQISTKDILIKELQEQKAYWKESSFDWRHNFFKKGSTKRLVQKNQQLTKVKDALRMIIDSYNHKERFSFEKDLMKAEQFLNSEGK